jgi:myo-inositol-1(or 4)-monophosphatase
MEDVKSTSWVLDPLDGTTNYVHRLPLFCISLALQYRGELVLGIVDLPILNRTYSCIKGGGAFVNGEKLAVSSCKSLSDALLGTGFSRDNPSVLKEQIAIFSGLAAEARGVRRTGSAAYDLCLVAEGVLDGFWEPGLKPWDAAAGTAMIREAGGLVCNYAGQQYKLGDDTLVAGSPKLFTQLSQKVKFLQRGARAAEAHSR